MLSSSARRHLGFWLVCSFGVLASCAPVATEEPGTDGTGGSSSPSASGGKGGSSSSGGSGGSQSSSGGSSGSGGGQGGSSPLGSGGTTASGGTLGGGSSGGSGGSAPDAGSDTTTAPDGPVSSDPNGPFPPGPHKVVLLDSSDHPEDPSRKDMLEVLNSMKATHNVIVEQLPTNSKAADLADKALIIAGPNTLFCSVDPDPAFKMLAVPIIVSKDCKTTGFGLGTMMNTANSFNSIKIVKSDHPLAAGLSGSVRVFTDNVCRLVRGANLGPGAIKIANSPVDDATWSIFAYEKGGMMPAGLTAPAKRIGFYWHRPSGGTPEGKKLFKAAVEWAIRP